MRAPCASFAWAATPKSIAVTATPLTPVIAAPTTAVVGVGKAGAVSGISLSETGNTTGETLTVSLADTNNLLSATGASDVVSGSGTKALTVTGSLAQVNAALGTVSDTDSVSALDGLMLSAVDGCGDQPNATTAIQSLGTTDKLTAVPTMIDVSDDSRWIRPSRGTPATIPNLERVAPCAVAKASTSRRLRNIPPG